MCASYNSRYNNPALQNATSDLDDEDEAFGQAVEMPGTSILSYADKNLAYSLLPEWHTKVIIERDVMIQDKKNNSKAKALRTTVKKAATRQDPLPGRVPSNAFMRALESVRRMKGGKKN